MLRGYFGHRAISATLTFILFWMCYNHSNTPHMHIIVERYVSNVFYSERIVRVFYSQSDKILGVFYPK